MTRLNEGIFSISKKGVYSHTFIPSIHGNRLHTYDMKSEKWYFYQCSKSKKNAKFEEQDKRWHVHDLIENRYYRKLLSNC